MISVDDFLAQATPRSVLAAFHDEITRLRTAGMSYHKIQLFLKLNGIETHVNNVRGYCQRHIEKATSPTLNIRTTTTQQASNAKKTVKATKTSPKKAKQPTKNNKATSKKTISKRIGSKKSPNITTQQSSSDTASTIKSKDLQATLF